MAASGVRHDGLEETLATRDSADDVTMVVMNVWPLVVEASNAREQTLREQLVFQRYHAGETIFPLHLQLILDLILFTLAS